MTYYKIQEPILQGVVNYLANRPFLEVAEMIKILTTLEKVTPEITDAPVQIQESTR